jgi:hypothetical protein
MHADTLLKRHLSAFIIAGLIFLSGAFLFMKNDRELDPDYKKNWWTLAFADPNIRDNRFIIVNHTSTETFAYEIKNDSETIESRVITVPSASERTITPESPLGETAAIRVWPTNQPNHVFSLYRK